VRLKALDTTTARKAQRRGYFDEHLTGLYSSAYGKPYLYRDSYLVYEDPASKAVSLTLFALEKDADSQEDRLKCLREVTRYFQPARLIVTSPLKLPDSYDGYVCEKSYADKDYQIFLEQFDENLVGGSYKGLRYHVNHAKRQGYSLVSGKVFSPAHISILASFLVRSKSYEIWDYQLYLALGDFFSKRGSHVLFNVFSDGLLVGFDVVDALSDVLCVPLGFYLDCPSIADYLIYEEILYAKKRGFKWLDIGWACNVSGLEEFKVKWKAAPRFEVYVQVFKRVESSSGKPY